MPKEETHFKPGQSGNPAGRPKDPPEVAAAKRLTAAEFTKIVTRYLFMSNTGIKEALKAKGVTQLEQMVGKIVQSAAQEGNEKLATFILDRVIGKVPAFIEASVNVESLHMQLVKAMERATTESEEKQISDQVV